MSSSSTVLYTRLLQFHTPGCQNQFFMRFGLFNVPDRHPMLAFCDIASRIHFWDLARLTSYHEFIAAYREPGRDKSIPVPRPEWLKPLPQRKRATDAKGGNTASNFRDADGGEDAAGSVSLITEPDKFELLGADYNQETIDDWEKKQGMGDARALLKAHKTVLVRDCTVLGRQVAWSPGGEWCVVVGSNRKVIIMGRWTEDSQAVYTDGE